jgi:hypothetical protein
LEFRLIKTRTLAALTNARQANLPLGFEIEDAVAVSARTPSVNASQLGVTFKDSLKQGPFGWYPYVEGFSADYARSVLRELKPSRVYDPFGGSGTTCLAAGIEGITSFYSELNPLMRFVAEVKTNTLSYLTTHKESTRELLHDYISRVTTKDFKKIANKIDLHQYHKAFPKRDFFVESDARELLLCLEIAKSYEAESPRVSEMLKLAVAANAVKSSNMTRRADLRRRRDDEYKTRIVNVPQFVEESVRRMMQDLDSFEGSLAPSKCIGNDAKTRYEKYVGYFDCVLTSPPYLNGTNYFRNTKIELWLLGLIETELDIRLFNKQAVAGGIDNVRAKAIEFKRFDAVEEVAVKIEQTDGDRRIPNLVRQYFSDMYEVLISVAEVLHKDGVLILDIGDSKFYGVHVPTDNLLIAVADEVGLRLDRSKILARRHSRDKSPLVQVELIFKK